MSDTYTALELVGEGLRFKVKLPGLSGNCYILMTDDSLEVTVPRENSPENERDRILLEAYSKAVTKVMEMRNFKKEEKWEADHE